jgi:arabinogalactan oligomer/maltooligosaccharide transport system substrate-binding protein
MVVVMLVGMLAACGEKPADVETYNITMWVSEKEGVAELYQQQIAAFNAANPDVKIVASIEGVSEADAGSKVVADVASAPDIYCFAQDQLARLVQAAALAPLGQAAAAAVAEANDAGSVAASKVAGTMYAYTLTSDNGYYLYYDKSLISDPTDLTAIIEACEGGNKLFRYALENAWYTASFFFGAGCHSNWTMDENGVFTSVDDTFNSAEGLIAMKGMQQLSQSSCYDSNADIFTDAGAIVTGIWNATAAEEHFGENLGVAKLPKFTVDGQSYQLGSFSGFKLMGVKPQTDAKKAAVLSKLAQYLTNEECQLARFNQFQWGPSNKAAQANDAVKANASLAALLEQNAVAVPQGQIDGGWWDVAKVLGAQAKAATSVEDLQKALDDYDAAIQGLLEVTPEQRRAWTLIGTLKGTNWDTDIAMTEGPENTWTSEAIEFTAATQFKVRQGLKWNLDFGYGELVAGETVEGVKGGANITVAVPGTYQIVFVYNPDANTATITLVAVE